MYRLDALVNHWALIPMIQVYAVALYLLINLVQLLIMLKESCFSCDHYS